MIKLYNINALNLNVTEKISALNVSLLFLLHQNLKESLKPNNNNNNLNKDNKTNNNKL